LTSWADWSLTASLKSPAASDHQPSSILGKFLVDPHGAVYNISKCTNEHFLMLRDNKPLYTDQISHTQNILTSYRIIFLFYELCFVYCLFVFLSAQKLNKTTDENSMLQLAMNTCYYGDDLKWLNLVIGFLYLNPWPWELTAVICRRMYFDPTPPSVRDIDSPRSKRCEDESISVRQRVLGWYWTHAVNALRAKIWRQLL